MSREIEESEFSSDHPDHTGSGEQLPDEEVRDEVKEVKRMAERETRNVKMWKFMVVAIILFTGAAISLFTYMSLAGEEEQDYVDAVSRSEEGMKKVVFVSCELKSLTSKFSSTITV